MPLVYDKALFDAQYSTPGWLYGYRLIPGMPRGKTRHHYNWYVQAASPFARLRNNVNALVNGPGWASFTDIAIIGGAFGWTGELLLQADPTLNIINVETSPWVFTAAGSEEADLREYLIEDGYDPDDLSFLMHPTEDRTATTQEVWDTWLRPDGQRTALTNLDNDLTTNGQRRAVRQALGNNVDALVTELALDGQTTEVEIDNFLDVVEQTRPNPACTVIHLVEYTSLDLGYISKTVADWGTYLNARGFSDHWILDTQGRGQRADGATF